MASSRRSPPADRGLPPVEAAARAALAAHAGQRLGVALSGGRDSAALLVACARHAGQHAVALHALHVHHGLSAHADAWADACAVLAARHDVPLDVRRVAVADVAALGVEAAARQARYAALRAAAAALRLDAVMLAHHEDDQAETVLLQALRGAGPHGLAAMAARQRDAGALLWLRPLLAVPRAAIDDYVAARIAWVDDDSNATTAHRRNALRHEVMPAVATAFPSAARTLARVAAHQAEAAALLDDLAKQDAGGAFDGVTLACAALADLPAPRARNLLRWFLRGHGLPPPSTARLAAMLAQLAAPRRDAEVELAHAGVALGVHRGRIHVHAPAPPPYEVRWQGERELRLPHGRLAFLRQVGEGIATERLGAGGALVGPRAGGERLALHARRPRRALAAWLYDAGLPAWSRDALPLVRCAGEVVAVAALGVDVGWRAAPGQPGIGLAWHPDPLAPRRPG